MQGWVSCIRPKSPAAFYQALYHCNICEIFKEDKSEKEMVRKRSGELFTNVSQIKGFFHNCKL
jgi:hypothetical protein